MKEQTFLSIIKEEAKELTAKEWVAVIAGVLTFVILTGLCG